MGEKYLFHKPGNQFREKFIRPLTGYRITIYEQAAFLTIVAEAQPAAVFKNKFSVISRLCSFDHFFRTRFFRLLRNIPLLIFPHLGPQEPNLVLKMPVPGQCFHMFHKLLPIQLVPAQSLQQQHPLKNSVPIRQKGTKDETMPITDYSPF